MIPAEVLAALRSQGATVRLGPTGRTIRIRPASLLTAELRREIRATKPDLLDLLWIGDFMYRTFACRTVNSVSANETPRQWGANGGFADADSAGAQTVASDDGHNGRGLPGCGPDDEIPGGTYDDLADAIGAES